MNRPLRLRIAAAIFSVGACGSAVAQNYYAGAEFGSDHLSFQPRYTFVSGAPEQSYDNQTYGKIVGLLAGYAWKTAPNFSLSVQGRLSSSNSEWTLQLPEPAWFKYSVPLNVAVTLVPGYRISKAIGIYGEAGVAFGQLQERKSSVNTSAYDVKEWKPGGVLGAGLSLDLSEQWSARLGYRRTWYEELQFDTRLADGTKVETVRSKPVQSTWAVSLLRSF